MESEAGSLDRYAECTIPTNSLLAVQDLGARREFGMGQRMFLVSGISLLVLTLTFAGCKKKEEPPPPPAAPAAPAPPAGGAETKGPTDQPGGAPMEKKKEEGAKTK
jgi:hypothetical protein